MPAGFYQNYIVCLYSSMFRLQVMLFITNLYARSGIFYFLFLFIGSVMPPSRIFFWSTCWDKKQCRLGTYYRFDCTVGPFLRRYYEILELLIMVDSKNRISQNPTKYNINNDSSCAKATFTITMTYPSQDLMQARNRSTH